MYSNTNSQKNNTTHSQQITSTKKTKNNTSGNFDEMRRSISIQIREIENKIKDLDQGFSGDLRRAG